MLAEAEKSPWQETFAMWSLLLDGGTVGREKWGNSLVPKEMLAGEIHKSPCDSAPPSFTSW